MYPEFELVDVYQMFCHLLGIEPLANDGVWDRVKALLRNSAPASGSPPMPPLVITLLVASAAVLRLFSDRHP